ncbi:MAG: hypothetical protein ACRCU9_11615 [Iodobacter sp.]
MACYQKSATINGQIYINQDKYITSNKCRFHISKYRYFIPVVQTDPFFSLWSNQHHRHGKTRQRSRQNGLHAEVHRKKERPFTGKKAAFLLRTARQKPGRQEKSS